MTIKIIVSQVLVFIKKNPLTIADKRIFIFEVESGFEPLYKVLQTSA